jgi:hypothetical protein
MTAPTYDPQQLLGQVQHLLAEAGLRPAVRTRDLPAAMDAARALLGALGVGGPAIPQPTTRCITFYRMSLVDPAANVVLEKANAKNRTEIGVVASRWRAEDTRSRIDIEAVSMLVPAGPGSRA